MDTQQMIELLLARLNENAKTQREDMLDMKARLDENAKTGQQRMLAMNEKMETYLAKLDADREESKAWREKMKAEREAWREEMRADREQWKAKMDERMTATQVKSDGKLKELTEPREEMMQPAEEHQQVPREDAVVIPVRGRKRRHRGRKQAAERRGKPKELNRGDHGFKKKLAATCRKASRRATVAWLKRNVFRKSWIHGNCGPRKEVTASIKKVTRCERHRHKVAQRSPTGGMFESRCRRGPECSNGIRDRNRRRIKDPSTRRQLRLKIKWTSEQIDRKIFYEILRDEICWVKSK
jgi:hypothetical protein